MGLTSFTRFLCSHGARDFDAMKILIKLCSTIGALTSHTATKIFQIVAKVLLLYFFFYQFYIPHENPNSHGGEKKSLLYPCFYKIKPNEWVKKN